MLFLENDARWSWEGGGSWGEEKSWRWERPEEY